MLDLPRYKACRLCRETWPLRNSHVCPKFYWDWMKETGDGYFRDPRQPNRRLQDGVKLPMLCSDCEARFSKVETPFASAIFRPLMANPALSVCYGPFALRFLVSVLWRNLALDLDCDNAGPEHCRRDLEEVETEWRQYLLEQAELEHYGRVHLIVTDFAVHGSPEYNRYLTRDADATVMWTDAGGLLGYYVKFAKLLVFAEIARAEPALWVNTLVDLAGGTIRSGAVEVRDGRIGEFIIDRAVRFETYRRQGMTTISPLQRQKIKTRLAENPSRLANTELARALHRDADWNTLVPKVGRNERCPCGSGRKYKHCHGA